MKQYLDLHQTAELIELGFEKPKRWCVEGISSRLIMYKHKEDNEGFNYSIGELLSFLPEVLAPSNDTDLEMPLNISTDSLVWTVEYDGAYETASVELIDALCDMVVWLKEEGVI